LSLPCLLLFFNTYKYFLQTGYYITIQNRINMNKFTAKKVALLFIIFFATILVAQAQGLDAVNDIVRTGPLQTVSKNIIRNDIIPGDTYTWEIIASTLPSPSKGMISKNGDNIVFTPNTSCRNETFSISYILTGSGTSDQAEIRFIVGNNNNPVNIIDPDIECYYYMPENIPFDIQLKYQTEGGHPSSGNYIDGFTSPLVGDLNGDGKPEIVVMGNNLTAGVGAYTILQYINIYNGQTGNRILRYDITTTTANNGLGWSNISMGSPYHRAPTILALADLDNDGMGEIVICNAATGKVAALKPIVNSSGIAGLSVMWRGKDQNGTEISYKAPLTTTSYNDFGYPNPYIADLDADNIPEIIVYNKIYNGQNGHLLMSWQDSATINSKHSSIASNAAGLSSSLFYGNVSKSINSTDNPVTEQNAKAIRKAAMVGMRRGSGVYADKYLAVPAIVDIDGDGKQEIIAGNRIHKFNISNKSDHTQNTYTTIEGPQSVTVPESSGDVTYHLNDGFTRVADIDGDGNLDIIVATFGNNGGGYLGYGDPKIIIYVWDPANPANVKACVSFIADGYHGNFSIPFIGDINGKLDGYDGSGWTRKLPEICILGGGMFINRSDQIPPASLYGNDRTGIEFHPKSDDKLRKGANNGSNSDNSAGWNNNNSANDHRRFNNGGMDNNGGHIIGLTWDDSETRVEKRLKVSWAMEHADRSNNTGITLFDFDNNNTADLCYRDETSLRVISPAKGGNDYVEISEVPTTPGTSIMFSTTIYSGTAFEYPTIADVNMDGSADIVVTHSDATSRTLDRSQGWINVYEYRGAKWAPCPPVWNQGMYDPAQVREDLKINPRPISILKTYTKGAETIQPYNGSWMQVPIVKDEDDFVPVVRTPDAIITNMKVEVISTSSTTVTLEIFNDGAATIAASAPVSFYDGGTPALIHELVNSTFISTQQLGVDIFPNEVRQMSFNITGHFNDHLIWACVMVDNNLTVASGFDDCHPDEHNTASGADCPWQIYTVTASPDTVLCGTTDNAVLTATFAGTSSPNVPSYQWYRNDVPITGANLQTYTATRVGTYKCYVVDGICRSFSSPKMLTRDTPVAMNDNVTVSAGVEVKVNVLLNDIRSEYCNPLPIIIDGATQGNASIDTEGRIVYQSSGTFTGKDSLKYKIDNSEANVYFYITNLPDNVIAPDCVDENYLPASFTWGIEEMIQSVDATIHNYGTLTVGDIDGNDTVEIIGFIPDSRTTAGNYPSNGIKIFYFDKTEQKVKLKREFTFTSGHSSSATFGSMAIARYNNEGYIIVAGTDGYLYAYKPDGSFHWRSSHACHLPLNHAGTIVGITDFNGDGIPEIYTGNSIFSIDGTRLCDGGTAGNRGQLYKYSGSMSFAADMTGDGKPELCAGDTIYKVDLVAHTLTPIKSLSSALPANAHHDGATTVADINNDGQLDVIVVSKQPTASGAGQNNTTVVYVWTPDASSGGSLIGHFSVPSNSEYYGIPVIGNIDDTPYPEIIFVGTSNRIYALKYDGTQSPNSIVQKWNFAVNDPSSCTGMSLFDFDMDGVSEIVYHDNSKLYILDGNYNIGTTFPTSNIVASVPDIYSGNLREFPVIADIDNDGHAEIIVTGNNSSSSSVQTGLLRVFKSDPDASSWASARKVWNQYAYSVVNIHENLVVPTTRFNITTELEGKTADPADNIRPYNNFRQQLGYMDEDGVSSMLTPDIHCTQGSILNYDAHQDHLYISVHIRNTGDAAMRAPFYISSYKKKNGISENISIDSSRIDLGVGETRTYRLTLRNFSTYTPLDSIIVIVNDRAGDDSFKRAECNYTNNESVYRYKDLLLAHNDRVSVMGSNPFEINILANDSIPLGCTPMIILESGYPKRGTIAYLPNGNIEYTAPDNFSGLDTISYQLDCDEYSISTAKVYIMVYYRPDNISDAACHVAPESDPWNIKDVSPDPAGLSNYFSTTQTPLIGDVDGDGNTEILMTVSSTNNNQVDKLWIINGDGTKKRDFSIVQSHSGVNTLSAIGRIKYSVSKDTTVIITLSNVSHKLYAYDVKGTQLWTSDSTFTNLSSPNAGAALQLVDVDGDGWTEILAGNKIFAAESGKLICSSGKPDEGVIHGWAGADRCLVQTVAGDVLGIGKQQVCIGNSIYNVDIVNRANRTSNSMTSIKSITPKIYNNETLSTTDGATQLADFDLDGNSDIVVSTVINRAGNDVNSALCIYIWSPSKNKIIASKKISYVYKRSVPLIGDIDGDAYPEIVVIHGGDVGNNLSPSHDSITALKYNPVSQTGELEKFWAIAHNDDSGATGITLFDFNQDGVSELVYRDNKNLHIINGSLKDLAGNTVIAPYDLKTIACISSTGYEYPVVADIDNDGEAEIITVGPETGTNKDVGPLRIFEANTGHRWASARKVWNQYSYSSVNVNEDLTIPTMPLSPATVFPGMDNVIGTVDDTRPYNNFLQQQTTLNKNGVPLWLSPDPAADAMWIERVDASNINVCLRIKNLGAKISDPSLPVALYRGKLNFSATNHVKSQAVGASIAPDGTHTLCFTIDQTEFEPRMSVRIQDDGTTFPAAGSYLDCNVTNNAGTATSLRAVLDYIVNINKATTFNVLDNDDQGACGRGALTAFDTIAGSGLTRGVLTINPADSSFTYLPNDPNFLGVDSLMYYIKCGEDSSATKVYILIQNPSLTIKYVACEGTKLPMGFSKATGVEYWWYNAETGGNLVKPTASDTIIRLKDNTPLQTWWVEPRSGNLVFPRNRVNLELGNCDNSPACAINGTLLFKEDFGGNDAKDPTYKPVGIPQMDAIYTHKYIDSDSPPFLNEREYLVGKKGEPHSPYWQIINDHTHPATDKRGYFLEVNSANEKGQFYEHQIDGLCEGLTLYFSAWINNVIDPSGQHYTNIKDHVNQIFILEDLSGDTIVRYYTGDILNGTVGWKQYGFEFTVPKDIPSVKLKIVNNGQGSNGNDFALDDIEIRLCAPSVELGIKDTVVCEGAKLNIRGTYIEDCTFGDELAYRLEFRHIDSQRWVTLDYATGTETVNCDAADVSDRTLEALKTGWDISPLSSADEGYYRLLVSSPEHIDKVNCRASSDSVYVQVAGVSKAIDVRVDVCPMPDRPIRLSSYLDSIAYNTVSWTKINQASPDIINPRTGEIRSGGLTGMFTYRYTQKSKCGVNSAVAYVQPIKKRILRKTDTIIICKDEKRSRDIHLNQIFGLHLGNDNSDFGSIIGGQLLYNNPVNPGPSVLGQFIKQNESSSNHYGGLVFDAYQAWHSTSTDYDYKYTYRDDVDAKKFKFRYTATDSCVGDIERDIVIIVTGKAF
jgi:hypothetical protein